jgi:hypothetical protein
MICKQKNKPLLTCSQQMNLEKKPKFQLLIDYIQLKIIKKELEIKGSYLTEQTDPIYAHFNDAVDDKVCL